MALQNPRSHLEFGREFGETAMTSHKNWPRQDEGKRQREEELESKILEEVQKRIEVAKKMTSGCFNGRAENDSNIGGPAAYDGHRAGINARSENGTQKDKSNL